MQGVSPVPFPLRTTLREGRRSLIPSPRTPCHHCLLSPFPKEVSFPKQPRRAPFKYAALQLCSQTNEPYSQKENSFEKREGERWGREGSWAAAGSPPQWPQLLKPISCLYLLVRMLALRVSLESTVCSPRRW